MTKSYDEVVFKNIQYITASLNNLASPAGCYRTYKKITVNFFAKIYEFVWHIYILLTFSLSFLNTVSLFCNAGGMDAICHEGILLFTVSAHWADSVIES